MAFTTGITWNSLTPRVSVSGQSIYLHNALYKSCALNAKTVLATELQLRRCILCRCHRQIRKKILLDHLMVSQNHKELSSYNIITEDTEGTKMAFMWVAALGCSATLWLIPVQVANSSEHIKSEAVYQIGGLFELSIQLSYLILLLALLGFGAFFVFRQVLIRRELDLSAKELQEQVRSGDAGATELFELGAVMLRRKFYPAATRFLLEAIDKWDGDDQDLAQVYNALGVSYVREGKLEKGIAQFEEAVKLLPGYVTAWNNLGDAYEEKKELKSALRAFEEALLFDPNNRVARPRRDELKQRLEMFKGVPIKSKER